LENPNDLLTFFQDFGYVEEYGYVGRYIGILIITFLASIIVFIPVPYFPILFTAGINQQLDPHLVSLFSAVGAVIAKLIIFYVSYYGRNILSIKTKKRMLPLQRLVSKYGWPGAFAAAVTPIPDDLVYIPLGLAKYSPWKFASATFAGKFILNEVIVFGSIFLGRPVIESLITDKTDPSYIYIGVGISIVVLILIIYLYLKIDWGKIIGKWFPWTLTEDEKNDERPTG
jgi:membrane protein DedA with SNARE-associated domain